MFMCASDPLLGASSSSQLVHCWGTLDVGDSHNSMARGPRASVVAGALAVTRCGALAAESRPGSRAP